MPKEYKLEPRFRVEGDLQVFEVPKGFIILRLERNKDDGTLRLIAKKVSKRKKPSVKKVPK